MSVRPLPPLLVVVYLLAAAFLPAHEARAQTHVALRTELGTIELELYDADTPITVANFLAYLQAGWYDFTFFHRSVTVATAGVDVIQAGGFVYVPPPNDPNGYFYVQTLPPIQNEFLHSNVRGTIAMARAGGDPNSANSQWFINVQDNTVLDTIDGGFTVFGYVVDGMDVVDAIHALPVASINPFGTDVPLENYGGGAPDLPDNLVLFTDAAVLVDTPALPDFARLALLALLGTGLVLAIATRRAQSR